MTARVLGGMRGAPLGVREFVEPSLAFMGLLLIMTVVPAMLRWLWDVVRIEEGQVRAMAREACERHGVRVVGPLLWRTHGAMVNAAILGLFWPLRYLLVTDALLEAMPKRQLEGVLAHEVAHVRLAHIAWLGASVVASASALGWLVGAVVWMWPATGDVGAARDEETLATAAMLGSAAALGATLLTLGYVSRRFEWQADAFAVRHLSVSDGSNAGVTPQAAADMSGALATVASANGVPESRWGFRHGSIADRRMRVERLVGVALDAFEIDRVVRRIKWMIVLTIVVSVVAAVLPAVA
jgi:Zn-dependent protease with chaperone function